MKRNHKILISVLVMIASVVWAELSGAPQQQRAVVGIPESGVNVATSTIRVIRVVDGDTFEVIVNGQTEKIRMLGIDTPESVDPRKPVQCFAKEATKKLQELIFEKEIVLTPDFTNDDRDKYNRLLRYVSRPDGLLVNEEMIKEGYAYAYIKFPFERRADYLKLQTEARTMGRGLWATTTCSGRR